MAMRCSVFTLAVLLLAGCKDDAKRPSQGDETPAEREPAAEERPSRTKKEPSDHDIETLLGRVGVGAPIAFVVRPSGWKSVHASLESLGSDVPEAKALLSAEEPATAMELLLSQIGVKVGELEGLDPVRPIVGGLGEPAQLDPFASPSPGPEKDTYQVQPLRHVIYVPVTDARAFVASLPSALPGFATIGNWSNEAGAWTGRAGESDYAVAVPEGDLVTLTVFTGGYNISPPKAKAILGPRIDPEAVELQPTPALADLLASDSVLSLHVRPWRFRSLASYHGHRQLLEALATVDPSYKSAMMAKGLSVILLTEILMGDEGAELDDWSVSLRTGPDQLGIVAVGSLTPLGRSSFDAAQTSVAPILVKGTPALEAHVRMDLAEALESVTVPGVFAKVPQSERDQIRVDLRQMIAECSPGCPAHLAFRTPMRALRIVSLTSGRTMPPFSVLQGAMTSVDPPVGAIAAIVPTPEVREVEAWLASQDGEPPDKTESSRGDETVISFDLGESFDALFESESTQSDALFEASIRAPAFESTLGRSLGDIRGALRLDREGPSLVVEVAARRGADPVLSERPESSSASWSSPIESFEGAATSTCTAEIAAGYVRTLRALSFVAPEDRKPLVAKGMKEIETASSCLNALPVDDAGVTRMNALIQAFVADMDP